MCSPAPAQPSDYTRSLIAAIDITAPEVFTAGPPVNNPNGQPGAGTSFSNQDRTHGEGKAFVEIGFDGPPDAVVPPDFVTDVGQKQDTAIKKGLTG